VKIRVICDKTINLIKEKDKMNHKQIEECQQKVVAIKKLSDSGDRNKALMELSGDVGASGCGRDMPPEEKDAINIAGIHHALQTATMIEMCKTANRNFTVTIIAVIIALLSTIATWIAILKK